MIRYKLARIVNGHHLSANQHQDTADGVCCLEYQAGKVTSVGGLGVACYKKKEFALRPEHIIETSKSFNRGGPIALLKLKPIGRALPRSDIRYREGYPYEGGINYKGVEVLEITPL